MNFTLALISLGISTLILIISQSFFIRKNITDKINLRSSHNTLATRSGGIAIFSTLFLISIYYYVRGIEIYDYSLLIPLILLLAIGFYDDVYNIDFKLKFVFQIIAAKIIIDNGLIIDNFHGVIGIYEINRIIAQLFTIFIIVAIINAINFIDGIDGLAISACVLFIIFFEFAAYAESSFLILSIITTSSIIPLYYFNFRKEKKIFLGDSGSLYLGGVVSIYVLHILSHDYIIKPDYDIHKILFVISILLYPITDIIRIVFQRIVKGKSPFKADNNHIHHKIYRLTKSHSITTFSIIVTTIIFVIFIQILF